MSNALRVDWKRASFFAPRFRQHRHARSYAADGKESKDADGCFRQKEYKRQLTSGLLTIYCPHGVCHGFTLLRDPESERDVFNLFFTRIGQGRVGRPLLSLNQCSGRCIIVYDRACKLHTYCLKREPAFFYDSVFRVDIFHIDNHVACCEGYNPAIYTYPGSISAETNAPFINTQVAEQSYASIKALRTACAFMTQNHCQEFVRTFLAFRNLRLFEKMK